MKLDRVYGDGRRSVTVRMLGAALSWIFPSPCLACDEPATGAGRALGLCMQCRGRVARWPVPACGTCGVPLGSSVPGGEAGYRCRACRRSPPPYDALLAPWRYRPPLDAVLGALKWRRLDYLGPRLGVAVSRALGGRLPERAVVVPVPLHLLRRLARGYDQAALIARGLAAHRGWRVVPALRRRRATVPQSRLARAERLANPAGAFALARRRRVKRLAGEAVVLVDDVVTTGATAAAAAACLRRAGARSLTVVAVARTPPPETT